MSGFVVILGGLFSTAGGRELSSRENCDGTNLRELFMGNFGVLDFFWFQIAYSRPF